MIKNILVCFILILLLSCHDTQKKRPVTDMEVATAFIRDVLDNDFKDADQYLLKDETNQRLFSRFQQQYHVKDKGELSKYKSADIIINGYENVTDSVSIVNYSNSYRSDIKNKIKMVLVDGKWQVDFKYTFSGNL